ncbi:hypothetical protein [Nocardioides daejeonensis]|uniref:hypothetical protein n=1 Tax=Nocardioides daejeonensis TaxID=1046556 RepID=UPI000D750026|nr:hypothetical protein [Nocardioides daejeonensis]
MSSPVVFVHVGAPKTGTTHLQDRLTRNAARLAAHDVHFPDRLRPGDAAFFHFQAALDLLDQDWGGPPGHAQGAWSAMARQVRRRSGTVVISHEILAGAKPRHVARLRADLDGAELHVVYTVRDLARQLPAAWQESIKQGRSWSFARFLERAQEGGPWFMKAFDLPRVLTRWSRDLPPERVHVITVPRPGAPADELWLRFCATVGIDPGHAPESAHRHNESMGIEQAQVLRQLNASLERHAGHAQGRRRGGDLDQLMMRMVEQGAFAGGRRAITLPPDLYDWANAHSERWISWLSGSGVDVVGDLDELRPERPAVDARWHDPDRPRKGRMTEVSIDVLADFAREAARRNAPEQALAPRVRRTITRLTPS